MPLHGAVGDGGSWFEVTGRLQHDDFTVVAPAVPLHGIASAIAYRRHPGSKVLVGHSYGGALVSELADTPGVTALVYVAAFITMPTRHWARSTGSSQAAGSAPAYAVVSTAITRFRLSQNASWRRGPERASPRQPGHLVALSHLAAAPR
ncbi:alpha/beta fold hydrolase [Streptomyces sp. NPDC055722]